MSEPDQTHAALLPTPTAQHRRTPPCATPHSAPVRWLGAGASPAAPPPSPEPAPIADSAPTAPTPADSPPAPARIRHDGWSGPVRRAFLEALSEHGIVSAAARSAGPSVQSAYRLRNRDALFAAGWDAACELARQPLADALYERAVGRVTACYRRDPQSGAVEREAHDNQLAMAVLNRLDRRAEAAARSRSGWWHLIGAWPEFLDAIEHRWDEDAAALLAPPPPAPPAPSHAQAHAIHQLHQLSPGGRPPPTDAERRFEAAHNRIWQDDEGCSRTDFPPPDGFCGDQHGAYGEDDYHRALSPAEQAVIDQDRAAELAEQRSSDEELRDDYFFGEDVEAEVEEDEEDEEDEKDDED